MTTLAIVLTGGRSTRMGGRHKPALLVGGASIADRVIAAVRAADPAAEVVVAGSAAGVTCEVTTVREDPPFAGPLAGVKAALAATAPDPSRVVLLLAGDMPFLDAGFLRDLIGRAPAVARDDDGRTQFLCAAWDERALRTRLADLGDVANAPMKRLYAGADLAPLSAPPGTMRDVDSPEDLNAAR